MHHILIKLLLNIHDQTYIKKILNLNIEKIIIKQKNYIVVYQAATCKAVFPFLSLVSGDAPASSKLFDRVNLP